MYFSNSVKQARCAPGQRSQHCSRVKCERVLKITTTLGLQLQLQKSRYM